MKERFYDILDAGLFRARPFWFLVFLAITIFLGFHALKLEMQVQFSKTLPVQHEFVKNYLEYRPLLTGQANAIRVVVENLEGDIYSESFMKTLHKIHQAVFFIDGVNRGMMKSLWTPNVRFLTVTAEGFKGGPVIPPNYDGDKQSLAQLRQNVQRAGIVGSLVGFDHQSTVIYAPLLSQTSKGKPLDYGQIAAELEQIRDKYGGGNVRIHVVGYPMLTGTLVRAAEQVVLFFGAALLITLCMLLGYMRCWRSAVAPIFCSLIGVIWQLGLLPLMDVPLNPYTLLVPFLKFAIGVSHGTQMVTNIAYRMSLGQSRLEASRASFRALFAPGIAALLAGGVGFATLYIIEVPVIRELSVVAVAGLFAVVLNNLILLPLIMSYIGVSRRRQERLAAEEGIASETSEHKVWLLLKRFTERRVAIVTVALVAVAFAGSAYVSQYLHIGDVGAGASELPADSQYNRDVRYISSHYGATSDVFTVLVTTPKRACTNFKTLSAIDRFVWRMSEVPGVLSVQSLANIAKYGMVGIHEGAFEWYSLTRNQNALDSAMLQVPKGMITASCSMTPVRLYLSDHKAPTLERVVQAVQDFKQEVETGDVHFLMAAGSAGVAAATNIVVEDAHYTMLAWVYAAVALLCLLTFRSIRAIICILVPLIFTSALCQALMVWLGIGVKVSTLPVIALGVGIGVDYGIYLFARLRNFLDEGLNLGDAYLEALKTAGRAVVLTGLTLSIGVATWIFSGIQFQADMGLLLTFMFLWNMVGAVILIPGLARLLGVGPKTGQKAHE